MKINYISNKYKIIAILLIFVFIISSVPISIHAQEFEKSTVETMDAVSKIDEPDCGVIPNDEFEDDVILGEVISRREETVKHFDLGHGMFRAVTYGSAVHRKDANGEWKDIDNRLFLTDKSDKKYATSDGRITVSADLDSLQALISIYENGYTISMTPAIENLSLAKSKVTSSAQIINHSNNTEYSSVSMTVKEAAQISNTTYAKYSNLFESTDVEYVFESNDVKENIIVKSRRDSYKYSFNLSVDNLIPKLTDSGEIILYDSSTGNEEYRIPAPYMYDSAGELSYNVYYELKELNEDYIINVIADKEWINAGNRVFPVTIDPTITKSMIYDTYIKSSAPTTNYGSSEELWISSNCISFLRSTMPTLPSGCQFHSAKLYVYYYYHTNVTSGSVTAGAYKVNHPWDEIGNGGLTWNIASPSTNTYISATRLSTGVLSGSRGAYKNSPKTTSFDVTSAAASWYTSPSTNYGIALKYESGTNGSVVLKSYEAGSDYRAYYVVTYIEPNIVSGVYKIKNSSNGLYLDVNNESRTDGTPVIQYPVSSNASQLNQLFKITYIGRYGTDEQLNYYSIRTMLDSHKGVEAGFSTSNRYATIETISISDSWSDLSYNDVWAISKNGNYYTLKNGYPSSNSYLTSPSNSTSGEQIFTSETITNYSKWILESYNGEDLNGANFINYTGNMIVGESFKFEAYMYSSKIGINGPIQYSVRNIDGTVTDKAIIDDFGRVTALKPGQIRVRATYSGAPWIWYRTVTIEESLEGTYLFKNVELGNYMQLDNNGENTFELWDFDGGNDQKWQLIYVSDGYYKVQSVSTGKVATSPDDLENEVWQDVYNGREVQLWRISKVNGQYKLSPKKYPSYYMAAGKGTFTNQGRNVKLRVNQSDGKDEWEIYKTILQCWNSDSDRVNYWNHNPSLYTEKIDTSSTFYFNNGINSAKTQWQDALNIDYLSASEDSADIKCYGASRQYFETYMGKTFDSTTVGLTTSYFYDYNTTYWGDTCKSIGMMTGATIYILSLDYDSSTQKEIVVHEFGHAMGYAGHSQIRNNVMYPYCHSDYTLKPEEIAHLKQFYN